MADAQTIEALREALEDEYRARATYRKVIEISGPVRPFVNIVEAEERHARALLAQFDRLGVKPPEDTWSARIAAPRTLSRPVKPPYRPKSTMQRCMSASWPRSPIPLCAA